MPPAIASAASNSLAEAYAAYLVATDRDHKVYRGGARWFLARWPDPSDWVAEPLQTRLAMRYHVWPFVTFLMLQRGLRPGYDYLFERRLVLWREVPLSPMAADVAAFVTMAARLGYRDGQRLAGLVTVPLLIQSGRRMSSLTEADFTAIEQAMAERELQHGRPFRHYRSALHAARTVSHHLGCPAGPAPDRRAERRWSTETHLTGVSPAIQPTLAAYLECCRGTRERSTMLHVTRHVAGFGRHLAQVDPELPSLAELDRQRHIEPFLAEVAQALHPDTREPLSAETRRKRILAVRRMLSDIAEWGWHEAPKRCLIFSRDVPRVPRPLPRYLPPDADRRLSEQLVTSPHRLRADALLLLRATGLRIGELLDLELDCVHEVPGQGAWLKVPLGKLKTERMVPLDAETVDIVDRIVAQRSPGRPLRHPRSGRLVDFLLTHRGQRISGRVLRRELDRAASEAHLGEITPHQLRHTYATALVNAGVSLQALMALLGHQCADMTLRYARLFDATVRADYEKALALAKERLGPVLPPAAPAELKTPWRETPLLKARLAGGYCLRTAAQGVCPYTNICEYCPNFRSDKAFLPILAAQRVDAQALAADAASRGWGEEATRHQRLAERLDQLMDRAQAADR